VLEPRTNSFLDRPIGFRHRRSVRLGVDPQVGRAEARQADRVGGIGEVEREREVGVDWGNLST
jgi:hypothetical protein